MIALAEWGRPPYRPDVIDETSHSPPWPAGTHVPGPDELRRRGRRFRELHERGAAFVIPNPWDVGSARLLARAGFEALATTSAGFATSIGVPDGQAPSETVYAHIGALASASDLPVTADLEAGFGPSPAAAAGAIAAAAKHGAVGGSIEDLVDRDGTVVDIGLATERVAAAVEAARALPFEFTLTARCECFLAGQPDLAETIRRLSAYQEAGADVLYAPGLTTREEIVAVTSSVDRPVNVVMGLTGTPFSVAELAAMGVTRISLGSTLARVAYGALMRATAELHSHGTFAFSAEAVPYAELNAALATSPTTSAR